MIHIIEEIIIDCIYNTEVSLMIYFYHSCLTRENMATRRGYPRSTSLACTVQYCIASLHKLAAVISWPPSPQLHRALT